MGTELEPNKRGSYYRLRTHFYPGPNTSVSDFPHVISFDSHAPQPSNSPSEPAADDDRIRASSSSDPELDCNVHRDVLYPAVDHRKSTSPAELASRRDRLYTIDEPRATTPEIRRILRLEPNEEVSLRALADPPPGQRPVYSYPTLIMLAINESRNKQLTLQEIYHAIECRFMWYRDHPEDKSWQNSIRHNLSLNKCFRRIGRHPTDPGKGSYWALDLSQGPGRKRPSRRNKKPTKADLRLLAEGVPVATDPDASGTSGIVGGDRQGGSDDVDNEDSGNDSDDVRLMLCDDTPEMPLQEPEPAPQPREALRHAVSPFAAASSQRPTDAPNGASAHAVPSAARTQEPLSRSSLPAAPSPYRAKQSHHTNHRRSAQQQQRERQPPVAGPSRMRRPPSPPYLPPLPLRRLHAAQNHKPSYLRLDTENESADMNTLCRPLSSPPASPMFGSSLVASDRAMLRQGNPSPPLMESTRPRPTSQAPQHSLPTGHPGPASSLLPALGLSATNLPHIGERHDANPHSPCQSYEGGQPRGDPSVINAASGLPPYSQRRTACTSVHDGDAPTQQQGPGGSRREARPPARNFCPPQTRPASPRPSAPSEPPTRTRSAPSRSRRGGDAPSDLAASGTRRPRTWWAPPPDRRADGSDMPPASIDAPIAVDPARSENIRVNPAPSGNRRGVYTDSRGTVYPSTGPDADYSSDSDA